MEGGFSMIVVVINNLTLRGNYFGFCLYLQSDSWIIRS